MTASVSAPPPRAPGDVTAAPRRARIRAVAGMELRLLLRNGENLLVTFAIPVGALAVVATVDALPSVDEPFAFLVGATVALGVFASSFVAVPITTAFAREAGVLKRLGVSPLTRGELVAAKLCALGIVVAVQVALILVVGALLGWRSASPGAGVLVGVPTVLLLAAGGSGAGLALAGRLAPLRTLAVTNTLFVVALLTSGLAVPVDQLPAWLAWAALVLPVAPAGAVLGAVLGDGAWAVPTPALAVVAVWGVLAPLVAVRLFRWWDD